MDLEKLCSDCEKVWGNHQEYLTLGVLQSKCTRCGAPIGDRLRKPYFVQWKQDKQDPEPQCYGS